jgi:hypothetical protein
VRLILAVVIAGVAYAYQASLGGWTWLLYAIALIMIITVLTGYCVPYQLFGISTCGIKQNEKAKPRKRR